MEEWQSAMVGMAADLKEINLLEHKIILSAK